MYNPSVIVLSIFKIQLTKFKQRGLIFVEVKLKMSVASEKFENTYGSIKTKGDFNMLVLNHKLQKVLQFLATSKAMDWIGVAIIFAGAYFAGWFTETLGMVNPHAPAWMLGLWFGFISTCSSALSLVSDRLDARLNKYANWLSLLQTLVAMWIDYELGNKSAFITYPITFVIYMFAIHNWAKIGEGKARKPLTGTKAKVVAIVAIIGSIIFSALTNFIGFQNFSSLYWLTTIVFAMSLIANIYSALKLQTQWGYWIVYNFVQLFKNLTQMNASNVIKYVYYIVNSFAGHAYWKSATKK